MGKESTQEFLEKVHEKQRKDEHLRKTQGNGHPEKKLPNKQH